MNLETTLVNGSLELVNEKGQVCSLNGELVADDSLSAGSVKQVWRDFYDSPIGEEFHSDYYDVPGNPEKLLAVLKRLYPDGHATVSRLQDAFNTAAAAGEILPEPEEVEAAPIRNESGQFANALDLEVKRLIETNPTEINRRVRVDRAFAAAVDRVMYPKVPTAAPVVTDPELNIFAELYIKTPYSRAINGEYFFPDGFGGRRYSIAEYNALVERCAAAKLIR